MTCPDWVPGRTSISSVPSRVSSGTVVPSAAAVIGSVTRAVQVVAAPLEDRVRALEDLDVQVTGGAVAGADLALAGELDAGAGVDARRGS